MNETQFTLIIYLALVSVIIMVIYVVVMRRANAKKSKWGINLKALKPGVVLTCPACGTELPKIRKPTNLKQFLWGGFTCKSCGKEYDKWFVEISS